MQFFGTEIQKPLKNGNKFTKVKIFSGTTLVLSPQNLS